MSAAYQQKLDRFKARFTNQTSVGVDQSFELWSDLHDLISVLQGRVSQLEEQVTKLNQTIG